MRRMLGCVVAVLMASALWGGAARGEIVKTTGGLDEVRAKLFGVPGGEPGLIAAGKPFVVEFEDLTLAADDGPRLLAILQEGAGLPSRSEVILLGTLDKERFRVKWERVRSELLEVNVRGMKLDAHGPLLEMLGKVTAQRVNKIMLYYAVSGRRFELKFEENP